MLVLRDICQPVLDKENLDFLHVTVDDKKTLCLAGECGQVIVAISSIRFAKQAVSEAERKIAVKLFSAFIEKHKEKLSEFVSFKRKVAEERDITMAMKPEELGNVYAYNGKTRLQQKVSSSDNIMDRLEVYADEKFSITKSVTTSELAENLKRIEKVVKRAAMFIVSYEMLIENEQALREMQQEIQQCKI